MTQAAAPNFHETLMRRVQAALLKRPGVSPVVRANVLKLSAAVPDEPDRRATYFIGLQVAWMVLTVASIVVGAVPVAIATALGHEALRIVASVTAGVITFCCAGTTVACWWHYEARWAVRQARRSGTTSAEYQRALRRATPSGRTIPYQVVLGIAVAITTLLAA